MKSKRKAMSVFVCFAVLLTTLALPMMPLTIVYAAATGAPGTPVLSADNWDGDGEYTVTMNMWWGNNGTSWKLYEKVGSGNYQLVYSASLTDNSPNQQTTTKTFSSKSNGTYTYKCDLINSYGTTYSSEITVNVTNGSVTPKDKFLVVVSNTIYSSITQELNTYKDDLGNEGWDATIIRVNNVADSTADYVCPDPQSLKNVIEDYYDLGYQGFVLIGSAPHLPVALVQNTAENTLDPTDLYYSDMDDGWVYNSTGGYFTYSYPSGDTQRSKIAPEMIWGRISAGCITSSLQEEVNKVKHYLGKIHDYRVNGSQLTLEQQNRALNYMPAAHKELTDIQFFRPAVSSVNTVYSHNVSSINDYVQQLQKGHQFVYLAAHSSNSVHEMPEWTDGVSSRPLFTLDTLNSIPTEALKVHYLDMLSCSACRYHDLNGEVENLGTTYLFNSDYMLNVSGVTRSANFMYPDKQMFIDISDNTIGYAIKNYFSRSVQNAYCVNGVLFGDPTIRYETKAETNEFPIVTNQLQYLETWVGNNLDLDIQINDPDSQTVNVMVEGLPTGNFSQSVNMVWDSGIGQYTGVSTLNWIPSSADLGKTYRLKLKATDSSGNTYEEDFAVYVSHLQNGLLDTAQYWNIEGNISISEGVGDPRDPVSMDAKPVCLTANNSSGAITQNVQVKPNTDYRLVFWGKNKLTSQTDQAFGHIDQLGIRIPFYSWQDNYSCNTHEFNSGGNTSLTISLHAGEGINTCSGSVSYTGVRLVELGTQITDNLNFESVTNGFPDGWNTETFTPANSTYGVDTGYAGSYSAKIVSTGENDARLYKELTVEPNTQYRLSGYIKTENVQGGANGAVLTVDIFDSTEPLLGTNNWTYVQKLFTTGSNQTTARIECRLGHFGNLSTGTAWFDNLCLEKIENVVMSTGFENGAPEWVTYGGNWTIDQGKYCVNAGDGYKSIYTNNTSYSDFTYEADVLVTNNSSYSSAGIVFRATNTTMGADNLFGYEVSISAYHDAVYLSKFSNSHEFIGLSSREITADTVHHIKVMAVGSNIKVYVDDMDTPVLDVNDSSYATGTVGLRTYRTDARFDNIMVRQ